MNKLVSYVNKKLAVAEVSYVDGPVAFYSQTSRYHAYRCKKTRTMV